MIIPDLTRPETLDMGGEAQLQAVRELVLPIMRENGDEAYCRVDLWRNHPAVLEALEEGDFLILAWPDGSTTLAYAMSEAILSPIPTAKAQHLMQYFKHQRALAKRGDA